MAHLSPSAIFSPSVARQQIAAAKDWNYVDGWLTAKFSGKPAPPFERNNDTLKALLALAALNEAADEDCDLLSKVESKALQQMQKKVAVNDEAEILQAIEDHLTRDGHTSLNAMSSAAVAMGQPLADPENLAQSIMELQITSFNMDQASDRVSILQRQLSKELQHITAIVDELHKDTYRPSPELSKQTLDYQRKTKVLAAKMPELSSRVTALMSVAGSPQPTVPDVRVEEENFRKLTAEVKELEAQVKSYHGLPHDVDLARLELEELRVELQSLTRDRDGMFEGLVERESPKKSRSLRMHR